MARIPKLLLFDLMQTILAVGKGTCPYWYSMGEVLESEGIIQSSSFRDRYSQWRSMRDRSDAEREVTLHERLSEVVPGLQGEVLERVISVYMGHYAARSVPVFGVESMLRAWYGRVPMGVVSNFFVAGMPQTLLQVQGLSRYFDFIIDSASIGYRKPSMEIFRCALARARVKRTETAEVVMIGDDWNADVLGAQRAGLSAMLYAPQMRRAIGVEVIRAWDDFRPWA